MLFLSCQDLYKGEEPNQMAALEAESATRDVSAESRDFEVRVGVSVLVGHSHAYRLYLFFSPPFPSPPARPPKLLTSGMLPV